MKIDLDKLEQTCKDFLKDRIGVSPAVCLEVIAQLRAAESQLKAAQEPVAEITRYDPQQSAYVGIRWHKNIKEGDKLYAAPVPANHFAEERNMVDATPAVSVTEWVLAKDKLPTPDETVWVCVKNKNKDGGIWLHDTCSHDGDVWAKREKTWEDIVAWAYPVDPFTTATPSPRITEQDALAICYSFADHTGAFAPHEEAEIWANSDSGRVLLTTLNAGRADHIAEAGKMTSGWQGIDSAPLDGTPIIVNLKTTFRYLPYRKGSNQLKNGIKGRWQVHNGYGWDNCETPVGEWRSALVNHSVDANKIVDGCAQ